MKSKILFLFLAGLLVPIASFAVLGEKITSVKGLGKVLDLKPHAIQKEKTLKDGQTLAWTAYEMKKKNLQIKEHVSADGIVFAVTWKGIQRPNLKSLLGDYHQEFFEGEKNKSKLSSLRTKTFETEHLLVRESGQARHLQGVVILKQQAPSELKEEDLQ